MNRANWRFWRSWASSLLLLPAGCGLLGPAGLPQDPLFISRQPIQTNAANAAPTAVAAAEPALPPIPAEIAKRPAYARRQDVEPSDRVVPSGRRDANTVVEMPRSPRLAPGVLTNRPAPQQRAVPEPQEP
jgi:hypothetical protein